MWLDTGEMVELVKKLDEAEAALSAYIADDTSDVANLTKVSDALAEMREMVYSDIASADSPKEIKQR